MRNALLLLAAAFAAAQTSPETPKNGSISGVVRDSANKAPVENVTVSTYIDATWSNGAVIMGKNAREVSATTNAQGQYSLKDLPPGRYSVMARKQRTGYSAVRMATVSSGEELVVDFAAQMPASIAGTVTDEAKEPMPEAQVILVAREYYLGAVRYNFRMVAGTDDHGRYALNGVPPGVAFLIMARKQPQKLAAISEEPADPKVRRQAFAPTLYPSGLAVESAAPVTLLSGERREGVDIRIRRTPSLCVEGATRPAAAAMVEIVEDQPSSGVSSNSGMFLFSPMASTGDDGKFRFCGLHPGTYRITAIKKAQAPDSPPAQFGVTTVTVRDEDLREVKAVLAPGLTLKGEFVWDGPAPADPLAVTANFFIQHLYRAQYGGEDLSARGDVPSEFVLKDVQLDEYAVRTIGRGQGVYVKDVTYGGLSVLNAPLRVGSAMGDASVKVILARDGGGAAVEVIEDGKPVGDVKVYIFPADIRSEAELPARIFSGSPDQNGNYQTGSVLAPGKYFAIALRTPVDATPESIGKLWRGRTKAKEVEIGTGKTAQVNLEPASID